MAQGWVRDGSGMVQGWARVGLVDDSHKSRLLGLAQGWSGLGQG
jgi:hypothetical protein